jgi:hypothetical protein
MVSCLLRLFFEVVQFQNFNFIRCPVLSRSFAARPAAISRTKFTGTGEVITSGSPIELAGLAL